MFAAYTYYGCQARTTCYDNVVVAFAELVQFTYFVQVHQGASSAMLIIISHSRVCVCVCVCAVVAAAATAAAAALCAPFIRYSAALHGIWQSAILIYHHRRCVFVCVLVAVVIITSVPK